MDHLDNITESCRPIGLIPGRRLFVCQSEPSTEGRGADDVTILSQHLRHLLQWERDGVLFAAGPLPGEGRPNQRATYLLRATSMEEARAFAIDEPFHRTGLRTFAIYEWTVGEGRVSVHIDFSSSSGRLDPDRGAC